jgi:hypothetical protein
VGAGNDLRTLTVTAAQAWDHAGVNDDARPVGARIAEAVDVLRARGVRIDACTHLTTTVYTVGQPAYRTKIIDNPARFLGLDFDLLRTDGSSVLNQFVDIDLYNISLAKYRWFASETETETETDSYSWRRWPVARSAHGRPRRPDSTGNRLSRGQVGGQGSAVAVIPKRCAHAW